MRFWPKFARIILPRKATTKRSAPPPNPAKIRGAKKGILPVFVEPALASLADVAPSGPGWLHELSSTISAAD